MVSTVLAEHFNVTAEVSGDNYVAIRMGTAREIGWRLFWLANLAKFRGRRRIR